MAMKELLPPFSENALDLKLGLYEHYKGGRYQVLGVGRMEAEPNQEVVVYKSLTDGTMWVRPLASFLESVDGEGYMGLRFRYIAEQ